MPDSEMILSKVDWMLPEVFKFKLTKRDNGLPSYSYARTEVLKSKKNDEIVIVKFHFFKKNYYKENGQISSDHSTRTMQQLSFKSQTSNMCVLPTYLHTCYKHQIYAHAFSIRYNRVIGIAP